MEVPRESNERGRTATEEEGRSQWNWNGYYHDRPCCPSSLDPSLLPSEITFTPNSLSWEIKGNIYLEVNSKGKPEIVGRDIKKKSVNGIFFTVKGCPHSKFQNKFCIHQYKLPSQPALNGFPEGKRVQMYQAWTQDKIHTWWCNPICQGREEFVSSLRELHDQVKPISGRKETLVGIGAPALSRPFLVLCAKHSPRREGSRLQLNTGHSSKTCLPACHVVCLGVWCGKACDECCPGRFFFSCVACDIIFENLLTFRITGFLLTLLLVLVEWEFSWKDEALFTLVIEWLWRRKGMGQKQGTSNCCHTHADKTTSL